MYNQEIKERYIEEYKSIVDKYFFPNLFSQTEPYEVALDKDISNFTAAEIENFYKTENYVSLYSLNVDNSALSIYTNWCINNLLVKDSQNHFQEFSRPRLARYLNKNLISQRVLTKERLDEWIGLLENPSDQFLLYGLFYGISGRNFCELWGLRESDIDIRENKINIRDKGWMSFPHELCSIGLQSAETYEFTVQTGRGERTYKYERTDNVIKEREALGDASDYRKGRRIYFKLVNIFKFFDVDNVMTAKSVMESGLVHRILEGAEGMNISPEAYLRDKDHRNFLRQYYGYFEVGYILGKYKELLGV